MMKPTRRVVMIAFIFILPMVLALQSPGPCFSTTTTTTTRRAWLMEQGVLVAGSMTLWTADSANAAAAAASSTVSLAELKSQLQQAQSQLERVPALIQAEQWDSVRAILISPPLADCWAKTNRPLVAQYAQELGDRGGDELAALEAREELTSHLRYLDMAVYNNVFNPITVEGKSGATKELIRSYYEDPMMEYQASKTALLELIGLGKEY
mmetsp:Transcript_38727/g.111939  ORF Transcript_38727/g.111939 Transcript_38727/m.111939 type:complete len:210 (-) Transcript_38727:30-659(-)